MENNQETPKTVLSQLNHLTNEEISWLRGFIKGYEDMLSEELEKQKKMLLVLKTLANLDDNENTVKVSGVMSNGESKELRNLNESFSDAQDIIAENSDKLKLVQAIVSKFKQFDGIVDADNLMLDDKPIA